jgi:hypothetical protein
LDSTRRRFFRACAARRKYRTEVRANELVRRRTLGECVSSVVSDAHKKMPLKQLSSGAKYLNRESRFMFREKHESADADRESDAYGVE